MILGFFSWFDFLTYQTILNTSYRGSQCFSWFLKGGVRWYHELYDSPKSQYQRTTSVVILCGPALAVIPGAFILPVEWPLLPRPDREQSCGANGVEIFQHVFCRRKTPWLFLEAVGNPYDTMACWYALETTFYLPLRWPETKQDEISKLRGKTRNKKITKRKKLTSRPESLDFSIRKIPTN